MSLSVHYEFGNSLGTYVYGYSVFDSCYIKFVFTDLNPSIHIPNKW